jgi:hypothetical protein
MVATKIILTASVHETWRSAACHWSEETTPMFIRKHTQHGNTANREIVYRYNYKYSELELLSRENIHCEWYSHVSHTEV